MYNDAINNTNVMADSVENFKLGHSSNIQFCMANKMNKFYLNALERNIKIKLLVGLLTKSKAKEWWRESKELEVFHKVGMGGFMLFMSELVSWCWDNNIPIGIVVAL